MSDSIASVYSEARSEYTKQLCTFLVPAYFKFFLALLDKARELSVAEPRKMLWHYQTLLNDIPEWNMEKVSHEIATLQAATGCDYLEDLLTAVFIAHTKVLTAIRISSKQKKVQITVPKVEHFLFKVLCESAKLLWGNTFLFTENATSMTKQQNYRSIEGLLGEGVMQAVRAMVPVKNILKDFVSGGEEGEDGKGDSDSEGEEEVAGAGAGSAPVALPVAESPAVDTVHVVTENAQAVLDALANGPQETTPPADIAADAPAAADVAEPAPLPVPSNPTIVVDTRTGPRVGFTDFDAMMDIDNPHHSDIVYEPKEGMGEEDDEEGLLEILDEQGTALGNEDVEDLDEPPKPATDDTLQFASEEFDVLT
jgi:uncharacterized spore protein YtfJ